MILFGFLAFDIVALVVLVLASVSDIKTRIVPPVYQYLLAAIAVLHTVYLFALGRTDEVMISIGTGLMVFIIYIVLFLIFKSGIGGADTKVTSIMALYLGFGQTIYFILAHAVAAISYALYKRVFKKQIVKSVPLMPYLVIGFIVARVIWWIQAMIA